MQPLPKETTLDPKSMDRIFNEMQQAYEKRKIPMSDDQAQYTVSILMGDDAQAELAWVDLHEASYQFAGFFKRCEIFPIKYDKKLQLWLTLTLVRYGIGGMILVAYYVQWWAATNQAMILITRHRILKLDDVLNHCFPLGVFDEQTIHEFWDKQKVRATPDNLIDHPIACMSFMPMQRTTPITHEDHVF